MVKEKSSNSSEKIFFFLRHNNDIDHIVPVIYKWLSTEKIPVDIILTTEKELLNDFRINLLRKFKNINIYHMSDIFDSYFFRLNSDDSYLFFARLKRLENNFLFKNKSEKYYKLFAEKLFKDVKKGVVVFDWKTSFIVQKTIELGKKRGFISVSLPHGDAPFISCMELKDDIDYSCRKSNADSKIFDYVVVPNKICFKRYENHLPSERIKILGSPRYCNEWMNILSDYIKPYEFGFKNENLKIVFFLRGAGYSIFWEEVLRTIKLILQFPNISLIVKHHPRDNNPKKLTKDLLNLYPELKEQINVNLKFIYGPEDSSRLLKWADIIVDMGSSVTWESIKQKKPVLMIEYLLPSYGTISYYIKASEIKSRDKLYDTIKSFTENKKQIFYNEKQRQKFIKEVIDVPDEKVLERYCKFLKWCLNESR